MPLTIRKYVQHLVCALTLVTVNMAVKAQEKRIISTPAKLLADIHTYRDKYPGSSLQVMIPAGTYYAEKPLEITPEDVRGLKAVTIQGAGANATVISGGAMIKATFLPWKNGIYVAKVAIPFEFDQLYVNNEAQVRARYPNYDSSATHYHGYAADAVSKARIASWKDPAGGYIHALHKAEWGGYHYLIQGVNEDTTLQLAGGYQNNRQMGMHSSIRFVENIFEELDTAREWYYDKHQQQLYYKPAPEVNPAKASLVVSKHQGLIILKGSAEAPLSHVTIRDIRFTQCRSSFMDTKEPLLRSDWAIYRGGVVLLDGTRNCVIRDCDFDNNGGNTIFLSNYNKLDTIAGNHIYNNGASGICFAGNADAVRAPLFEYNQSQSFSTIDTVAGPKTNHFPDSCLVNDNLIHDIGQIEKQIAGVQLSMSAHITVAHNSIYNLPRAGINVSEGTWGGHIIEYNDVFNTVLETGDHGSFNSWGRDRWWYPDRKEMDSIAAVHPWLVKQDAMYTNIIRNNRFRCDHGWDIDLDDGSSNYEIYNNVCLHGGLKLREGFGRKVYNNIIINNSFHPHVWFKNSGDEFRENIVMTGYKPIGIKYWGRQIDHNFFPDSIALASARAAGTDAHSSYGDPGFKAPATGDYTVTNAAVFTTGFRNIDMYSFGVIAPRLKRIAARPVFPALIAEKEKDKGKTFQWKSGVFKNIVTLGERSATGMADNNGVLVIKAPSPAMGLQENDVILELNHLPIKNITTLEEALDKVSGKFVLKVFRGQKAVTL
ncbi:PDZ domain-containing protein [Chitinophaga sp. Cy-1792]|uniref:PDZ domain-containing protein n=1 Tax=Chitinophaga sp. Cy-1792 TaxID=2608339 RepID=UPI00141D884A|nr:PDZ domain-containing protein [Chitinophaga sp. Cy-1792]NIG54246.1 PDZ domain-containing protein [Chitinophaga sp. Cy-1792]